eukprot:CAMPEP_0119077120 /NCGR_PEP_ID=MMETSP1178-20130426/92612_1 /TAXON_ID=33656 /ORGANISM="unid sp, Strain CCMP2000" /LENGTH=32 /DNA_ID= /DNA_START= /DNA_END= /DNA_ORIENTATION=
MTCDELSLAMAWAIKPRWTFFSKQLSSTELIT